MAKAAAYTCGVLLGYDPKERRYYVGHVVRERVSNPEALIVATAAMDGKNVAISIPQDPGAAGKIQSRAIVAALSGMRASATPESGDKVGRAEPVAAQAEVGNVSILPGEWNEAFLDEIEKFPSGAFKDQVDALSRAFGHFVMFRPGAIIAPMVFTAPVDVIGTHPGW